MTDDDFRRVIRYCTVVFRGLFVLAGVFFLVVMLGGYVIHSFLTTYRATALIEIKPGAVIAPADAEKVPSSSPAIVNALLSPEMLTTVINDLDLDKRWAARLSGSTTRWSREKALTHLQKNLRIEAKSGTDLIQVTAFSDQAAETAEIANELVNSYMNGHSDHPAVYVVQEAKVPAYAFWPNRRLYFRSVYVLATLLSIGIASSVEMIFLILRASERPEN